MHQINKLWFNWDHIFLGDNQVWFKNFKWLRVNHILSILCSSLITLGIKKNHFILTWTHAVSASKYYLLLCIIRHLYLHIISTYFYFPQHKLKCTSVVSRGGAGFSDLLFCLLLILQFAKCAVWRGAAAQEKSGFGFVLLECCTRKPKPVTSWCSLWFAPCCFILPTDLYKYITGFFFPDLVLFQKNVVYIIWLL